MNGSERSRQNIRRKRPVPSAGRNFPSSAARRASMPQGRASFNSPPPNSRERGFKHPEAKAKNSPLGRATHTARLSPIQKLALKAQNFDKFISLIFLLPLIFLGVMFLLWPRQLTSQSENRALAQAPEFSWEKFFSGEFNAGIDEFYADQFPLRDSFLSLNRGFEGLLDISKWGNSKDSIHLISARKDGGGQGGVEHIPSGEAGQASPTDEAGNLVQEEAVPSSTESEEMTAPQPKTPAADREIAETELSLKNDAAHDWESSNIVIINGRAMEIHYYSPEFTEVYANRINHLRKLLPEEVRLTSLVAPTSVAFYGTDDLRTGAYSSLSAIRNIYEHEAAEIYKVDAYTKLAEHMDEYLYYRTDHHWNGLGAYYAYVAFCEALGLEATPLEDMTLTRPEQPFLGSLYGYTQESPLLLDSKDTADIYLPKYDADYYYFASDDMAMENPIPGTLLAANVFNENHYMLYLGGDVALGHIKSENENGKSICVIKDSYGNGFIPYLIDNFEDIYIIDPRQFSAQLLPFIEEHGIQDVMVLNYTFAISNTNWLDGFDAMTGYIAE